MIAENQEINNSRDARLARLAPHQWKKGQSGNPKGRPPTKTVKEYVRETLSRMTDAERDRFLLGMPKLEIWKMAEGNPHSTSDETVKHVIPQPIMEVNRDTLDANRQTLGLEAPKEG